MSFSAPDSITATNAEKTTITVKISKRNNGQLHELGRGANGVVYKAIHNSLGKDIALKKFTLHPAKNQGAYINMVLKTAKSVESSYFLSSVFTKCNPGFLCFYGLVIHPSQESAFAKKILIEQVKRKAIFLTEDIDENTFYILYEYVKGKDLDVVIRSTKGDINYRKHGLALLNALVNLRNVPLKMRESNAKTVTAQMVHLDIKPSNMMIETDTDTLKIIDLNTICIPIEAKGNGGCKRQSMTFEFSGPETYVAPLPASASNESKLAEIKEERKRLFASDIFAAGLTLYEMIMKKSGIALDERSIIGWLSFWDKKRSAEDELDLFFTPDKMKWAPLIKRMTKRDYKERPNAVQALAEFKQILDWEEGRHYGASQEAGFRRTKNKRVGRRHTRKI
jgi:serine/threonine protein kinase